MSWQEEHDLRVLSDISEFGWHCVGVFPTKDQPGQNFNYSVGLWGTYDLHPELLVVGPDLHNGHGIIASAVRLIEAGHRLEPGRYYQDILEDYAVATVEVLDMLGEWPMTVCRHIYGSDVRGLQLVLPDKNHRFPWDADYDTRMNLVQGLAGIWSEASE